MSFEVPETHFCYGCESNKDGKCMHIKSAYRRMLLIRKRVARCNFRTYAEKLPEKEPEPEPIVPEEIVPQEDDLTKIVEISEKAAKEPNIKSSGDIDPGDGDIKSVPELTLEIAERAVERVIDLVVEKKEETEEDPKKGESLTQMAIEESIRNNVKERLKEGEKIAKSILIEKQPLAHVESVEDGSDAAGPTPPIDDHEEEEKEEIVKGPTGITLHPKGQPSDGDNGNKKEKGRLFLEEIVDDIEGKSELPKNGSLKAEIENKPEYASETCVEVLEVLDKINETMTKDNKMHIDPQTVFDELEDQPLEKGLEIGVLSDPNIDPAEPMFCFNCQKEHPIGYFSPEGNICLNCVQIELRRVLFQIRRQFFDPSVADQELLDEVFKEEKQSKKRLSMLETLYIARDLLQSYSPLNFSQKSAMQIQNKEEMPAMSSPFLITCEEMEPRVQKLTWAQLQSIARKMEIPLNQPIDWIAAQVCARIKRCDKCDQLKLSKT